MGRSVPCLGVLGMLQVADHRLFGAISAGSARGAWRHVRAGHIPCPTPLGGVDQPDQ